MKEDNSSNLVLKETEKIIKFNYRYDKENITNFKKWSYAYRDNYDLIYELFDIIRENIKEKDIKIITEKKLEYFAKIYCKKFGKEEDNSIIKLDWNNSSMPNITNNTLLIIIGTGEFIEEKNALLKLSAKSIEIINCFPFEEIEDLLCCTEIDDEVLNKYVLDKYGDMDIKKNTTKDRKTEFNEINQYKKLLEELEEINDYLRNDEMIDRVLNSYVLDKDGNWNVNISKKDDKNIKLKEIEDYKKVPNEDKNNIFEELREYKKLFDEGIITEEEFSQKKKKLMEI